MPSPLSFGPLSENGRFKWSQSFAPTSNGPGMADLPCVAVRPISLAYSGLIVATGAVERTARCQTPRNAASSTIETRPARRRRETVVISLSPFLRGEGRGEGHASAYSVSDELAESPPHPDCI